MATVTTVDGFDVTSANFSHAPTTKQGIQPAFYSTGSPDIKGTFAMFAQFPHALRIDQANGRDDTADFYDVEPGCYSATQVVARVKAAMASYKAVARPGQRWPAVYASRKGDPGFSVGDVVTALDAAGLHNAGIGLVIADWNNDRGQAISEVAGSVPGPGNPYPVVGRQYKNVGPYDLDIFSVPWLLNVSKKGPIVPPTVAQSPPGQWNSASGWTWKHVKVVGVGLNGELISFDYNPSTGQWGQKDTAP